MFPFFPTIQSSSVFATCPGRPFFILEHYAIECVFCSTVYTFFFFIRLSNIGLGYMKSKYFQHSKDTWNFNAVDHNDFILFFISVVCLDARTCHIRLTLYCYMAG